MTLLDRMLVGLSAQPKTASQLAYDLEMTTPLLESALLQLSRGGYIAVAEPGAEHCAPACGSCSMTSMCSNSNKESDVQELWRLAPKGLKRVSRGYAPLPVA